MVCCGKHHHDASAIGFPEQKAMLHTASILKLLPYCIESKVMQGLPSQGESHACLFICKHQRLPCTCLLTTCSMNSVQEALSSNNLPIEPLATWGFGSTMQRKCQCTKHSGSKKVYVCRRGLHTESQI